MANQCAQLDKLAILILASILIGCAQALAKNKDYCSLCEEHIACKNNGSFAWDCSDDRKMVKMTTSLQKYILMLHNQWRNDLALGKFPGFKPAERMPVMEWSKELSYLAELNSRKCRFAHDKCHATVEFPYSGQNIAWRGNTAEYEKTAGSIKEMIKTWFVEYEDADMSYINAYREHDQGKQLGHFTVMANERNNRVGCAMTRHQSGGFKKNYFVCNYGYNNIRKETVYTPGKATSACKYGKHPLYKGLCSTKEQIKPLPGNRNN